MIPTYEIGVATDGVWTVLVAVGDHGLHVCGPWMARHVGRHWPSLEAVERATMIELDDRPRTIYVVEPSVVGVCLGSNPDDGFAGLRLRLREGMFTVRLCEPTNPPPCVWSAMDALREFAHGSAS